MRLLLAYAGFDPRDPSHKDLQRLKTQFEFCLRVGWTTVMLRLSVRSF